MQYKEIGKTGKKVSILGMGTMRLPEVMQGNEKVIDEDKAIAMIRHGIDEGINYIDTAYMYHDGQSEVLVGKALKDGYREKAYIATKSPVWLIQKEEDFDILLNEQLEKLQTDHIDFYLLHALNKERFEDTVLKFNLIEKMEKAKEDGRIGHIGFSFHDDLETFKTIVDATDKWEFCQIQFNYIDTYYQAGIEGLRYAADKGLGVIIMEPLLGGKLANPPQVVLDVLGDAKTPVESALDFVWGNPEVSLLLSGMSTMDHVKDNLVYADRANVGGLTEEDYELYARAKKAHDDLALVPCTKCRYCLPCPSDIDIPRIFAVYNSIAYENEEKARNSYSKIDVGASSCIECRQCEEACPQNIEISQVMKDIAAWY
ncbi:MAG: aldo/keto reductase [Clostridiales bacterium]|nr:aldo/keto reductase [Clostridiales bacterium]